MQAFAAETANGAAHGTEAFYADPAFWVLIAFVALIVLAGKKVVKIAQDGLDKRADEIRARIEEATRLHEEARELLASYERKQRDAAKEADAIVAQAREEADRMEKKAAAELEATIKRREAQAMDRIAQAEAQAAQEVRTLAVDLATKAAEKILRDKAVGAKATALIDAAIKELPEKLH